MAEKQTPDFLLEEQAKNKGFNRVCGIDEAGRGPLAGPVYAAAVVLDPEKEIPGLNDSKKLTPKKRDMLFSLIIENAVDYSVASATVEEIDNLNILGATCLAMNRAWEGLNEQADYALVDGNRDPRLPVETECVVKGDARSMSIAAASILAKVSRDRHMLEIAKTYPEYLFEKHKGYGTKAHYKAIIENGVTPIHRRTFLKNLDEHRRKLEEENKSE